MTCTHLVVGGGTTGCVLAGRLSEDPGNHIVLIEAGRDFSPGETPPELLAVDPLEATGHPEYFWPGTQVRRGPATPAVPYEQARVIGGGSSINGQVSLRGAPIDFDEWHDLGAEGWGWDAVLPFFRKLERDADFGGPLHGTDGPLPIRRYGAEAWDRFSAGVAAGWSRHGFAKLADINGDFSAGWSAVAVANDGARRISTATAYLDEAVRRRPNLRILSGTTVARVLFDCRRATGVSVLNADRSDDFIAADNVILCAGALHSPKLLMLSGVGPAENLAHHGIDVHIDLPGVGRNLQNHAVLSLAAYLPQASRDRPGGRGNYVFLRYSSGVAGTPDVDMGMTAKCGAAWHPVGRRLGTVTSFLGKPFARGQIRLASPHPRAEPDVSQNLLGDPRDAARMQDAFLRMAAILATVEAAGIARHPFPASYSERVKKLGRRTAANHLLSSMAAAILDAGRVPRDLLIDRLIADGPSLGELIGDPLALEAQVRARIGSAWHDCGTCRMGRAGDPDAVTDAAAKVFGTENLYVADTSIMPSIPRTNTNLTAIMIGERIAELLRHPA